MADLIQERTLLLQSNVRETDKLNAFENPIPHGFLEEGYFHQAAVVGIGLHAEFKNRCVPRRLDMPSIFQVFAKHFKFRTTFDFPEEVKQPLKRDMFEPHECYFLDQNKEYTPHELHQHLFKLATNYNSSLEQMFQGFISRWEADDEDEDDERETNGNAKGRITFSQYNFPFKPFTWELGKLRHRTILFFHDNFWTTLGLGQSRPDLPSITVMIENDLYHVFTPTAEDDFLFSTKTIEHARPRIIQISCEHAVRQMVDRQYLPLLKRTPLDIQHERDAQFFTKHFKHLEFIPLLPSACHQIKIILLDEEGQPLRLTAGYSTYVILYVKSYSPTWTMTRINPQDRFTIHLSSRPTPSHLDNEPHHFTAELAETLFLKDYMVSLQHIVYPSQMHILPGLRMSLRIEDPSQENVQDVSVPLTLSNCQEVINHVKKVLASVTEITEWDTGHLRLKFKKKVILHLGSSLSYILGHTSLEDDLKIDGSQKDNVIWHFANRPQRIQLTPASLFLFSKSLCEYSMWGSQLVPLLAVIDHMGTLDNVHHYVEKEITKPHFIPVAQTQVKKIELYLYSHDGAPLSFQDPQGEVFVTLAFERRRKRKTREREEDA